MAEPDFPTICHTLVSKLDSFRGMWLGVVFELLDHALADSGESLVNRTFEKHRTIPELAERTPPGFPFNEITGETVESALIGFQSQTALHFALAGQYLGSADFNDYASALLAASGNREPWLFSVAVFFGSSPLSIETLAAALSRYFLHEHSATESVFVAERILKERLPFLGYFTQVATAIAFGDESRATQMMQQMDG